MSAQASRVYCNRGNARIIFRTAEERFRKGRITPRRLRPALRLLERQKRRQSSPRYCVPWSEYTSVQRHRQRATRPWAARRPPAPVPSSVSLTTRRLAWMQVSTRTRYIKVRIQFSMFLMLGAPTVNSRVGRSGAMQFGQPISKSSYLNDCNNSIARAGGCFVVKQRRRGLVVRMSIRAQGELS